MEAAAAAARRKPMNVELVWFGRVENYGPD